MIKYSQCNYCKLPIRVMAALLFAHGRVLARGYLWVPKTCASWPDARLTVGCLARGLPGHGMIFDLWG
jgi:hypothetical protein